MASIDWIAQPRVLVIDAEVIGARIDQNGRHRAGCIVPMGVFEMPDNGKNREAIWPAIAVETIEYPSCPVLLGDKFESHKGDDIGWNGPMMRRTCQNEQIEIMSE